MFFGTHRTRAFTVTFVDHLPRAVSFGYKRKELSIIPIVRPQDAHALETYGSVLASICMDATVGSEKETGIQLRQFIATGLAAENMAKTQTVRRYFSNLGSEDEQQQSQPGDEDGSCIGAAMLAKSLIRPLVPKKP